jgi:sialate O-acetylesterase
MQILSGLAKGQVLQRLGSKGAEAVITGICSEAAVVPSSVAAVYDRRVSQTALALKATISSSGKPLKGWNKKSVGKIADGKFTAKLSGIPAGGPYRLRLEAGKERAEIASFFVGDVWIMAGQSNMEGLGEMTRRAKSHPLIRTFSMRREWRLAEDPLHVIPESPDPCHTITQVSPKEGERLRRTMIKGVGVGIFFAREMLRRSRGVPQGLIATAHGGTTMTQWDPARKNLGGDSLYWSMLTSVRATGQPVAGVLWYQGEGDTTPEDKGKYTARMQKLIQASRDDLKLPRLPWFVVQLGRHFAEQTDSSGWDAIREHQRLLPSTIKFVEVLPAIDLSCDDTIHIGSAGFPLLGLRMAAAADHLVYGNKREPSSPKLGPIREIGVSPNSYAIEVTFDSVVGGLRSGSLPTGFMLTSPEGVRRDIIYRTELRKNSAILHLGMKPIGGFQLWYGHGYAPYCNVTDARGFSIPAFGPIDVEKISPKALTPFINEWRVTGIIPIEKPLDQVALPDLIALGSTTRVYPPSGFISENPNWVGKSGQAFFHARLHLSEPMKLEFLMGYDGPFRLWLDGDPFFINMKGANPCFADESAKTIALKAGVHDIHIGMDLANGSSWGFFLRFARKDVTPAQIRSGEFVKPTYSV